MSLTYENFCTPADVLAYKRVKRVSMKVARVGREVAAEMVGGALPTEGKEFVETAKGKYRLSLGGNSDNTTEQAAHARMHAETIVMGDRWELGRFFGIHGLNPRACTAQWLAEVRRRLV